MRSDRSAPLVLPVPRPSGARGLALVVLALTAIVPERGAAAQGAPPRFTARDALDLVATQIGDLSPDGRWLAATASTRRDGLAVDFARDGDPSYLRPAPVDLRVIDTRTGEARRVLPAKRTVRATAWSPDGERLALLVVEGEAIVPMVWTRATGALVTGRLPAGRYVAENSELRWTGDGRAIAFAARAEEWRRRIRARFDTMTAGPVFAQASTDPFLAWDALRREGSMRSIVAWEPATGRVRELLPERRIATWTLPPGDSLVAYAEDVTSKTDYDVIFGTESKLVVRSTAGQTARVLLPSTKGVTIVWTQDAARYAYGKDGKIFVVDLPAGTSRQVAGPPGADSARGRERFTPLRFSPVGDALVASNAQGLWLVDATSGTREMIAETGDSTSTGPRLSLAGWSGDGRYIYLASSARASWERGFARWDRRERRLEPVLRDARLYAGLRLAAKGDVAVLSVAEGNRPADLYAADLSLGGLRRLTTANPGLDSTRLGRTRLVSYLDVDGKTRHAVAYLPPDFAQGTRYPTVFNVYEEFFDDPFDATIAVLNANGYVVVRPSVGFEIGYPGEAWVKGVTAAANKLIELGIADSARLGVHGTSYGGYATNLLIAQTDRFKAAINISGKVDVISFYTDSPRLGVRNVHAAEKSQDRLGATLWQQPQKYVQHSAVMFADRIRTPLLLLTGELDSNVPAGNTREMYYALRRLGKEVEWVNYMRGGHGAGNASVEDFLDYHRRIVDWYDAHLKRTTDVATARMERQLAEARAAFERDPRDVDAAIWLGRRLAYLGRLDEAMAVYGDAIARHPNDARLYRHRGHRYITLRRFDEAIRDLATAARLVRGRPDQVEPDGQPNARGVPTSTLQGNIWYHLGLAHYLRGEFAQALDAYREGMKVATDPDMRVATAHWTYMTLRRLGREQEAAALVAGIPGDLDVTESGSYLKLVRLYQGRATPEEVLASRGAESPALDDATLGYGVGNWYLYTGRPDDAARTFARVLAGTQKGSFGYLAAEVDARRLKPGAVGR